MEIVLKMPKSRVRKKKVRKNQPPREGTMHLLVRHVPVETNKLAQDRAEQEGRNVSGLIRHWMGVYAVGGDISLPTYTPQLAASGGL